MTPLSKYRNATQSVLLMTSRNVRLWEDLSGLFCNIET